MRLLIWLLLTAAYSTSLIVAEWQAGVLSYLIQNDNSYICVVLFGVLALGSVLSITKDKRDWVGFLAELASYLGLAGSIYGFIVLFGGGFDDTARIAAGTSTALLTTIAGLAVMAMLSLYRQALNGEPNETA